MKKFLKLCATFTLVGALFVGCIDNKEPDGVKALREAKARLLDAHHQLLAANAAVNLAEADLRKAQAEVQKSIANINNATAESIKIQNDYDKAMMQDRIAEEKAYLQSQIQWHMASMYEAMAVAAFQQTQYLQALVEMHRSLAERKIAALDEVAWRIGNLLVEQANLRNERMMWQARSFFYQNVEVPFIERQLKFDLELAQLQLTYNKYMYDIWVEIKNLAISEYVKYAEQMVPKMEAIKKAEVEKRAILNNEKFKLTELQAAEDAARFAYLYSGVGTPETTISVPNVFDYDKALYGDYVHDLFREVNIVNGGNNQNPVNNNRRVATGVYNNNYGFYYTLDPFQGVNGVNDYNYPEGTVASLGYKNTLEQLKADYNLIKDGRIYGKEGFGLANLELTKRESAMNTAITNYKNWCVDWKDSYENVKMGPNWGTQKSAFTTAFNNYSALRGLNWAAQTTPSAGTVNNVPAGTTINHTFYNVLGLDVHSMMMEPVTFAETLLKLTSTNNSTNNSNAAIVKAYNDLVAALAIPDANLRTAELQKLPVNFLFWIQKMLIQHYVDLIKDLIHRTPHNNWDTGAIQISDVLGKITFNPGSLFELVVGAGNAARFKSLIEIIMGLGEAIDIVDAINKIMPAFYGKTADYLGATIYGQGPVFQKYNVATNWEYHAWFLIYILFENNRLTVGNNILTVNADNYKDAGLQLWKDFLGCTENNYPGAYVYNNIAAADLPSQSNTAANWYAGTAIAASNRVSFAGLAFNPNPPTSAFNTPEVAKVLAAENALRSTWVKWMRSLNDLRDDDKGLYDPWYRLWTVARADGSAAYPAWFEGSYNWDTGAVNLVASTPGGATMQPPWIAQIATSTNSTHLVLNLNNANKKDLIGNALFYFMPELSTNPHYPSLVNGVDIYWTNLLSTYAGTVWGNNPTQVSYYPGIAAYHSRHNYVNWNEWLMIGLPQYYHDPLLWFRATNTDWENNINLPTARVPRAFITIRNYNQYKFWMDRNPDYIALGAKLQELINPLETIVKGLYDAWMDATAARVLQEYVIESLVGESELLHRNYMAMMTVYDALYNGDVMMRFWDSNGIQWNGYDYWFNNYTEAQKAYDWHLANLNSFKSNYVYSVNGAHSWLDDFVGNMFTTIQGQIDAIDARLKIIADELKLLEETRVAILNVVVK